MSAQPAHPIFPPSSVASSSAPQPRCEHCGTGQHLMVDTIDAHSDLSAGLINVGYNCRKCGSSRSHAATVADVANVLNTSAKHPGLLQSGEHFLHCGAPMHTGAGKRNHFAVGITDRVVDPELEIYLNTRVLHCDECGFQMEIPDQAYPK